MPKSSRKGLDKKLAKATGHFGPGPSNDDSEAVSEIVALTRLNLEVLPALRIRELCKLCSLEETNISVTTTLGTVIGYFSEEDATRLYGRRLSNCKVFHVQVNPTPRCLVEFTIR